MLRPYQQKIFEDVRTAFGNHKSVMMQLPTGAGKTHVFSAITHAAAERGSNVWIMVPRKELLRQASEKLIAYDVPHGIIAPGFNESRAYNCHVVSKDTLIRRFDKVKTPPDFLIVDEAHIALDRYKEISERYPNARFLGVTATPERLDGRGLSDVYETLVEGPTIQELIDLDFLVPMRYFCPPIEGLDQLHYKGDDYDPDELERLLAERKIYGKSIDHYRKYADRKPCLIYCRSVKAAAETAEKFSAAGYLFEDVNGSMPFKKQRIILDALRDGRIDGIASCDLITYGLDIPRVECIIQLRPTLSRTIYFQMIGRGLRPAMGKRDCVILDHVGNMRQHGIPWLPVDWQFYGKERRKRKKKDQNLRLCPELDFMYCSKSTCLGCEHSDKLKKNKDFKEIAGELLEIKQGTPLNKRPLENRREFTEKINEAIEIFKTGNLTDPIKELLLIADELGYKPLWVYWLLSKGMRSVNVPVIYEIARIKGFKTGWAYYKKYEIEEKLKAERKKAV